MYLCAIWHHLRLLHLPFNLWSNSYILHFFFLPLDLEFSDSRLFNQNVSGKFCDIWGSWWVLNQLWVFFRVGVVHVVSYTEELLGVVVAAGQQDGGHTYDVTCWDLGNVRDIALNTQRSEISK